MSQYTRLKQDRGTHWYEVRVSRRAKYVPRHLSLCFATKDYQVADPDTRTYARATAYALSLKHTYGDDVYVSIDEQRITTSFNLTSRGKDVIITARNYYF